MTLAIILSILWITGSIFRSLKREVRAQGHIMEVATARRHSAPARQIGLGEQREENMKFEGGTSWGRPRPLRRACCLSGAVSERSPTTGFASVGITTN